MLIDIPLAILGRALQGPFLQLPVQMRHGAQCSISHMCTQSETSLGSVLPEKYVNSIII